MQIQEDKNTENLVTNEFKESCRNVASFCPKNSMKYKCEDMITEYRPFVGLLRKTRKLTINLYAEYVNLSHKNNGIFKMSHCYNINESKQCDIVSPYFNSFLEYIGLSLQKCNNLDNSEILKQYMDDFYFNLNSFLEKHLLFIKSHDLRKIKLTIKNQKYMRNTSVKRIKNDNCRLEKLFLSYMDKMDTMILQTVQKLNLNRKEQGRKDIKKIRIECRKIIFKKLSNFQNIYGNLEHRTIRMAKTKLFDDQKNTNHLSGIEDNYLYYEDYVDHVDDYYEYHTYDNDKESFDNLENQETNNSTTGSLKAISSIQSLNNKTDKSTSANYDLNNVTDTTPLIMNNYTESSMEDLRADSSNLLMLLLFFIISLGFITCVVGIISSFFGYFKNSDKKRKIQEIDEGSIILTDIDPDE
ncbi:hypothetical protein NBO_423g0005 [Nosema bombycis CQ1]|uniref:Uncharacterized protein n=1 Tax=Nosema bombycis (strain CQ1 / CVCC 102059) TaxID=578461 RepID=R0KP78_NOSB1|nr:hypothetical protein NBO_423g0005 [Nosema bombycis CQ1]|eukprot:EOB12501.1 hypothetical protein NBO_423g0005 [Nosema bombycis CQ1]